MFRYDSRQCPQGTVPYVIQAGDTLYRIAQRFNTTVSGIVTANPGIVPTELRIGQRICIPRYTCRYYTIRAGDNPYLLAQRFDVGLQDILQANPGIDPTRLQIGQVICIPIITVSGGCPANSRPYIIKPGDTFFNLARRFNISLSALVQANPGVNPPELRVGQRICIPQAAGALPDTKNILVIVEGQSEYRPAQLQRSNLGYYIYVLNLFRFTPEEPGRDVVIFINDDRFFMRIEPLPANADLNQVRQNSLEELRLIGTPEELTGDQIGDPFFRNARFFLRAASPTFSKDIIVMNIGGRPFRFTLNIPSAEAAEGVVPSFLAMIKTIGIL